MYNFATGAGMLQHAIQKAAAAASSLQYLVAKLYIGGPIDAMTSGSDVSGLSAVPLDTCEPPTHIGRCTQTSLQRAGPTHYGDGVCV
jgi:hypothetical protein